MMVTPYGWWVGYIDGIWWLILMLLLMMMMMMMNNFFFSNLGYKYIFF
jgi:hypothetical protein